MTRKTSVEIASIAARWLAMGDDEMLVFHAEEKLVASDEIRAMAGSCLSQVDPDADGHPPWTNLKSTNLKRCRFDPATARLDVEFQTGASGSYADVPADLAAQLAIAESPGRFLIAKIKGKFEWTRNPRPATGREELRRSVEEK